MQPTPNSEAPYFVEEVRRQLEKQYGVDEVHGAGLKVYTTLDLDLQRVANHAVLNGVATYERRKGWTGKLPNVVLAGEDVNEYTHPDWIDPLAKDVYVHGVVMAVEPNVRIKISSLASYDPDPSVESYRAVVEPIVEAFGPTRAMIASDWPVGTLSTDWKENHDLYRSATDAYSAVEQRSLFHDTAALTYRIGGPADHASSS